MSEDNNLSSKSTYDNEVTCDDTNIFGFGTAVVPEFPKLPNITKYYSNKRKTVNENNFISDRSTLIANYACDRAVKKKNRMMANASMTIDRKRGFKLPQNCYHNKLITITNTIEPLKIHKSWIENIIKNSKTDRHLTLKLEPLIEVVKSNYTKTMHEFIVNTIVKPITSSNIVIQKYHQRKPLKKELGGKTKNYPSFLKVKELLAKRLYTLYPDINLILYHFENPIPEVMIRVEKFTKVRAFQDINNFVKSLEIDFQNHNLYLAQNWYNELLVKLTKKFRKEKKKRITLPPIFLSYIRSIIRLEMAHCNIKYAAQKLFPIEGDKMERLISRSIDHVVQELGSAEKTPILHFTLNFDGCKCISKPSVDEICGQYNSILNLINNAVSELKPLESYFEIPDPTGFIFIRRDELYLLKSKAILKQNIDLVYEKLTNHLKYIENKFSYVVNENQPENLFTLLRENVTYEDMINELKLFLEFKNQANELLDIRIFEFGKINQVDLKNYLINLIESYTKRIIEEFVIKFIGHHETVCNKFEEMVARAFTKTKNTEEFIALGDYMLYVSTSFMAEMTKTIKYLSGVACNISQYAQLPEMLWDAQASSMKWLKDVKPIFVEYSTMYEVEKSNAEVALSKAISDLNYDLHVFEPNLIFFNYIDQIDKIYEYILFIGTIHRKIEKFDARVAWINREEELFNKPLSRFKELDEIKDFIEPFVNLITFSYSWLLKYNKWMRGDFDELSLPEIEMAFDDFYKEAMKKQKSLRIKCKEMLSQNTNKQYEGLIGDIDMNNWPAPLKIVHQTIQSMKDFRQYIPIVGIMCNPDLSKRHWADMSELIGFDLTPNAGTTLTKMIDLKLDNLLPQFDIISISATKENQLKKSLEKMKEDWTSIKLSTTPYKDTKINILSGVDDVQALLDDHLIKTISIRGSAFVKPIKEDIKEWYEMVNRMNNTLEEWAKVQVQWLYLMPIFSSKDIVAQMPEEGSLFNEINLIIKEVIGMVDSDPLAIKCIGQAGVLESLIRCTEMVETINSGVNSYLEKKRLFFTRFFFLSNDEMLEILSETKNPKKVQPHLKKCFEGIAKLEFNDNLDILKMLSGEGEEVALSQPISTEEARGSVEKWLLQVEEQMVISIRIAIENAFNEYLTIKRTLWVQKWPGQSVLCVSQIFWTAEVHEVFNMQKPNQMRRYHKFLTNQLNEIVDLVRSKLSKQTRISLSALVTLDVHGRDVVDDLANNNVSHHMDFKWLSQLRYYWENDTLVRITNATINYAYEYLGNTPRLVITPLTDRCYRTLISAYHLHLNGAPEGPAGTGKTETTKDLAKAIAVQCVVFNCSDSLDYLAMGKFFKGLASSGAWACFDEFNRIDIEVLSVVAQQILCIVQAVRTNMKTFIFEGTELQLNPKCYVCITMNPGYAGRSELPDNLKVLFRTVAMMVPDYAMIGEISLYSYGFVNARELSVKIVTTYKLCSEQLSTQSHYDYGMRAVKTVLIAAGNLKMKFPDDNESELLLRSILDVNSAKFLKKDVPLFKGIISDLFPNVNLPNPNYTNLISAATITCTKMNLQPTVSSLEKLIQTYEMMIVRHGFMLIGNPFGGKTSLLHLLAGTLNLQNQLGQGEEKVEYETVNPKSLTMGQLYGCFDEVSHEWSDGIVANTFRTFSMSETTDRKWLIFDGPVDAVWIENMNTVLDDNKKLCLSSGEVIAMPDCMSMIFEAMDLTQASPATVSRCGMIYLDPSTLGWRPLIESWIKTCPEFWSLDQNGIDIMCLFDWLTPPCLYFVRRNCVQLTNAGETNTVLNVLNILEMQLKNATKLNKQQEVVNQNFTEYFTNYLQGAFVYASIWGFGGTLDSNSRPAFDLYFKELWKGEIPNLQPPAELSPLSILIPNEGMLYDYVYSCTLKGSWKHLLEIKENNKLEEMRNIEQTLVPTLDTARYMHLVDMFISYHKPFLLFGPTGTGKSFYVKKYMMTKLSLDEYVPSFVTFTIQTSANFTQEMILSKLIKRKRGVYGPPIGKMCVIFVDDMNMPVKEQYGAQPPIELLRQYFDHGHWYDLMDTTKIYLQDVLLLSAIGPTGGSRQDVYARFLRHFGLFAINSFNDESVTKIFSTLLQIGLKRNGFTLEVIPTIDNLVKSTIELYRSAIINLAPTPNKSHYLFNLRDISKVTNGILMFRKESFSHRSLFVRLWVHEVMRVFFDRLVDDKDREWLFNEIRLTVNSNFPETFDLVFNNLSDTVPLVYPDMRNLLFTNAMDVDATDDKKYEEPASFNQFVDFAHTVMDEYDATQNSKLNIVLFKYAIEHLSKICRILTIPGGSALLVGIGGSGRQSLTRLAAAMYNYNVFQPEITKSYGFYEWREDLKMILKESGGKNRPTVFLFAEGQIKEEYFLQDIDAMLNSGEVPNLFTLEEQQSILEMVRLAAQGGNRMLDIAPIAVFDYFINRCKQNVHVCLCFSPIGSSFRNRLRLYPSMVSCCTIDWFDDWPKDALEMVAHKFLKNANLSEKIKMSAVTVCQRFHIDARKLSLEFYSTTRRRTYITSASYLDLIKAYTECISRKQKEIMELKMRYVGGLRELEFATVQVNQMKEDLFKLQPQLKKAQKETEEMMKIISRETVEVEKVTARVQVDEQVANVQAEAANALKIECETDLALTIPIFEDAINALNTLKPADITLVKSMKNPPDIVKTVMAAVCVMLNILPDKIPDPKRPGYNIFDYWGPSKRLLGDMNFLEKLKEYDKDSIPVKVMDDIRKTYLTNPNFKPSIVAKASSAAQGLCKWIIALDKYDTVVKIVAPKKEKLEIADAEFKETMAILTEKRNEVKALQDRLDSLKERLEETLINKENLLAEVALCQSKLIKAEKLIGSLGGEKNRWLDRANELQTDYDCIPGDILISCGIIAYLAPFTSQFRSSIVKEWQKLCLDLKIPSSKSYSLINVLGVPIKIQNWTIDGLPMDLFSIDNAIIMDGSQRYSLLIDPQGQAHKWIKTMEKSNDIVIVKLTNPNYMKMVEIAIEMGKPILIENVQEDLDPPLDPILLKQLYTQGKMMFIALGDNVIEYNPNFRLYITSKLRNPHYLPEIFNKLTIINFALTVEGLEDQLLGITVAKERPDLEFKRQKLIVEGAENAKALLDVENNILQILSAPGNILEDENAVDVLENAKLLSIQIIQKQAASVETVADIDKFRLQYNSLAKHCSILYYCTTDLPNIDPMYQYSLTWFINIFIMTVETTKKSKLISERLDTLKTSFTYNLYANVCRSLFEIDKTLFSFIICTTIMLSEKKIDKQELMFLMTGGVGLKNNTPNPAVDWLLDKNWDELCRLDELNTFKGIKDDFIQQVNDWKEYYDLADHEDSKFPNPWYDKLSDFQRILIVRTIRPDKVIPIITKLIESELGEKFVQPPPFDIQKSYNDSYCLIPLIFILSPGVDPMVSLLHFANKMEMADTLQSISLGQGQGPIAESLIQNAQQSGGWICLQNCHLATSWMGQLEAICDSFDISNVNSDFRLWLTSYPSDKFPVSVLQNGVKMTNEPPTGLQANMLRSYQSYPVKDEEFFTGCPGKENIFTKLLYGITFFHAVVQERKKFGPIGWNIPYRFDESDYHISIQQLQMYINEFDEIPFEAITYLTGECNYGGRVTDDWDRRTLNTILSIFCCPPVVEDHYYLFCDISPKYGIPYRNSYRDFIKQIEEIPAVPSPEVFGLHLNSGISRDLQSTMHLFDSYILVAESSGGTDDSEATENLLTAIASNILAKLPTNFDTETAIEKYPVMYTESMNTVLIQEMERFNVLLSVIRKSLQDLIKAIKGAIVMTPELETMATSLSVAKYPVFWSKYSYPSLKSLGGYITNFIDRLNFLQVWYENGKPDNFWLSGLFFTQAFLTGAIQNFARRYTIPIDQLCFDFEVQHSDRINAPPKDGVYCYGLYLDGARWDRTKMVLDEQLPKVLSDVLPLVWFIPIRKIEFKQGIRYTCPLYKTSERKGILSTTGHSTNYVLPIFLNTNKKSSHWIYRGVALLCQLND